MFVDIWRGVLTFTDLVMSHLGEYRIVKEKITDKIPDVHFDWYARFLPGAIAVVFYFALSDKNAYISAAYLTLYAGIGYGVGHIVQPLSSFIVGWMQKVARSDEGKYINAKKGRTNQAQVSKVSKAHAEAVSMLSTSLLLMVVTTYLLAWSYLTGGVILYFLVASCERVHARKTKIEEL